MWALTNRVSFPGRGTRYLCSPPKTPKPTLGPTQPQGTLYPGVERTGLAADHSRLERTGAATCSQPHVPLRRVQRWLSYKSGPYISSDCYTHAFKLFVEYFFSLRSFKSIWRCVPEFLMAVALPCVVGSHLKDFFFFLNWDMTLVFWRRQVRLQWFCWHDSWRVLRLYPTLSIWPVWHLLYSCCMHRLNVRLWKESEVIGFSGQFVLDSNVQN